MFQEVLGTTDQASNLALALSKYYALQEGVKRFAQVLALLHVGDILSSFQETRKQLGEFLSGFQKKISRTFSAPNIEHYLAPDLRQGQSWYNFVKNTMSPDTVFGK